ncbi:NRDE family protein [Geobacter sp. DSM 9736]|uniref:NRDE family protein n=1 Tax=Geobacter sp. DSM 9736 TaxID=1277350 RepID=UPI000B512681|nr:NRDE family protein [Geobacter sp. DSM 9736]SNB47779.1 Uncharacterized conserved protein, contains NRDE domain [Geobacter sp. DSM 9736]
MCLILFANEVHPRYQLIIAANRDEFYERPTAPAAFWNTSPDILAGKDLRGGGTWLGISRCGRFAAITNYREHPHHHEGAKSRGLLPLDFLRGNMSEERYLSTVTEKGADFSGFNLIFGTPGHICYATNRGDSIARIPPGIHGLSNHLLDTPWPKVRRGAAALADALSGEGAQIAERLFSILADRFLPPDNELPETGFGLEWERILSPPFITSPAYGTRASTVLLTSYDGSVSFIERTFGPGGTMVQTISHDFRIEK